MGPKWILLESGGHVPLAPPVRRHMPHCVTEEKYHVTCIVAGLTLYRMVMPIGTPFLKEKINN